MPIAICPSRRRLSLANSKVVCVSLLFLTNSGNRSHFHVIPIIVAASKCKPTTCTSSSHSLFAKFTEHNSTIHSTHISNMYHFSGTEHRASFYLWNLKDNAQSTHALFKNTFGICKPQGLRAFDRVHTPWKSVQCSCDVSVLLTTIQRTRNQAAIHIAQSSSSRCHSFCSFHRLHVDLSVLRFHYSGYQTSRSTRATPGSPIHTPLQWCDLSNTWPQHAEDRSSGTLRRP